MQKLGLQESDLQESFTRSGGKGGQNVNKVSTAVHLKHTQSGIEIKCSIYRTQGLNRYKARVLLCEKLEEKQQDRGNPSPSEKKAAKIRKQKQKRKKKYKQKLEELHIEELENEKNFLEET